MRFRTTAALVALLLMPVGVASAQTHRSHLGPHIAYNTEIEELALGVQFSAPVARFLEFYPSFDYWLVERGSLWSLNADLKLRVTGEGLSWLYFGGGLGIFRRSINDVSDNESGLNLFAGFETLEGNVHPFGEIRFNTADNSGPQITFGLNFTLNPR